MTSAFPKISLVTVYPTNACNFRCRYCFQPKKTERMSKETADAMIDFFISSGRVEISDRFEFWFFGGEPLLEKELMKYIVEKSLEAAEEKGIKIGFGITTNLSLLNDSFLEFMVKHNFGVIISYDGKYNQVIYRGYGNKKQRKKLARKVEENIKKLLATPLKQKTTCALQVPAGGLDNLYKNIMTCFDLGFEHVALNKIVDSYKSYSEKDLRILDREFAKIAKFILAEKARGGRRTVNFFEKRINALKNSAMQSMSMLDPCTCGAAKGGVAVDPLGSIFPCQRLLYNEFKLGSVFEGIDQEKRAEFLKFAFRQCKKCDVSKAVCAPCFAANYERYGDILKVPPDNCKYEKLVYKHAKKIFEVLPFVEEALI